MFTLPTYLKSLLSNDPKVEGCVLTYIDTLVTVLSENQLPFFPDYTDHGIRHILATLEMQVNLIPRHVKDSGILQSRDAALIICSTLLHDLAMHLREKAFLALVNDTLEIPSSFRCLWNDPPWSSVWADFLSEALRFSDKIAASLYGRIPPQRDLVRTPSRNFAEWDLYDRLLIGEFIRRHHTRMAFEFAIAGIPCAAKETSLHYHYRELADICGIVARSHGMELRSAMLALKARYAPSARPRETFVPYVMGLLRIADFLQIGPERGPSVLLSLRDPPSRRSVAEWTQHANVAYLHYDTPSDPEAIHVEVQQSVPHATYFSLHRLISEIQNEFDKTSAVLSEEYGRYIEEGFSQLRLAKTRISTNLNEESFCNQLSFVPISLGLAADPQLMNLVVEPLYAGNPRFAIRELIQNSVDAIRERAHATKANRTNMKITITLKQLTTDEWEYVFQDTGSGMTLSTIQKYFLKAGASFRFSPEWRKCFENAMGQSEVLRSGKFGIGIFSAFMLSSTIAVTTRHFASRNAYRFDVCINNDMVEVKKCDAPIGTTLRMQIPSRIAATLAKGLDEWYLLQWPTIRYVERSFESDRDEKEHGVIVDSDDDSPSPIPDCTNTFDRFGKWRKLTPPNYQAVFWTFDEYPHIICNGIRVSQPMEMGFEDASYLWADAEMRGICNVPRVSVFDPDGRLPLSLRRDELIGQTLPFSAELEDDACLDYIAFAMVAAPERALWKSSMNEYAMMYPLAKRENSLLQPETLSFASCQRGIAPCTPGCVQSMQPNFIALIGAMGSEIPSGTLLDVCPKGTVWIPKFISGGVAVDSNEPFYRLIDEANHLRQFMGIKISGAMLYVATPHPLQATSGAGRDVIRPSLIYDGSGILAYEIDLDGHSLRNSGIVELLRGMAAARTRLHAVPAALVPSFVLFLKCAGSVGLHSNSRFDERWKGILGGDGMLSYRSSERKPRSRKVRINFLRQWWREYLGNERNRDRIRFEMQSED